MAANGPSDCTMLPSAPSRMTRTRPSIPRCAVSAPRLVGDVDPLVTQQPEARFVRRVHAEDLDLEAGLRQPVGEVEAVVALVVLVAEMHRALLGCGDRRVLVGLAPRRIDRRAEQ